MTATLVDPNTGQVVEIRTAQLNQRCAFCGKELQGAHAMSVGDGRGWSCLDHVERRLASLDETPRCKAARLASSQLEAYAAGDTFVVTQTLLTALGTGR